MLLSDGWVSRWVASSICRGVASSEAEFPPSRGPAEGSVEGVSSEAELAYFPRVGPLPSSEAEMRCTAGGLGREASSEAEIVPRVRGEPRMGRRPSAYWASWELGEDPSAVGELEELYGVRVQSDDGVVIFGGFFLSRIAVE